MNEINKYCEDCAGFNFGKCNLRHECLKNEQHIPKWEEECDDEVTCPYCNHKNGYYDSEKWENETEQNRIKCSECGKMFIAMIKYYHSYLSRKLTIKEQEGIKENCKIKTISLLDIKNKKKIKANITAKDVLHEYHTQEHDYDGSLEPNDYDESYYKKVFLSNEAYKFIQNILIDKEKGKL